MAKYLLDTNVLSESVRPMPDATVMERIRDAGDGVVTAAVVWHELDYGRLLMPAGRRRRALDQLFATLFRALPILPYDANAATWHARERARLARAGATASFVDGQIAAIAATNDLVLVTRNVRDFARYTNLEVESWFS